MKIYMRSFAISTAALTIGLLSSCGGSDDSDGAATASSVADLQLSGALNLASPDGMAAASGGTAATLALSGESLNLVGKKSSEACRTMENTNQVLSFLQQAGSMFCHMEAESANLKFGTKYNISMAASPSGAAESLALWVDNSVADQLKVYMCQGGVLTQNINISGYSGSGKVKGSMLSQHSDTNGSGGINLEFDLTQAGLKIITAKMKHTNTGSNAGTYRNFSDIKLADSGVSTVKLSSVGTRGSDTFSDQASVLFNGTMGQALFTGNGTRSSNVYNWTSRSTFGSDGITVASTSASANIVVASTSLPEKLPTDFAPTAPSGWDCTGATETLTAGMSSGATAAAHAACNTNGRNNRSFSGCWGTDFEQGMRE